MEQLLPIIIQLISGAAGGNIVASIFKNLDLGKILNSIAGIAGGGIGGAILSQLGIGAEELNSLSGIITSIAGGATGGGVLLAIVAFIKKLLIK